MPILALMGHKSQGLAQAGSRSEVEVGNGSLDPQHSSLQAHCYPRPLFCLTLETQGVVGAMKIPLDGSWGPQPLGTGQALDRGLMTRTGCSSPSPMLGITPRAPRRPASTLVLGPSASPGFSHLAGPGLTLPYQSPRGISRVAPTSAHCWHPAECSHGALEGTSCPSSCPS